MFTFFVLYFAVSQTGTTHEMFRNKELDTSMLRPKTTSKIIVGADHKCKCEGADGELWCYLLIF
jgi:hypothetical protein